MLSTTIIFIIILGILVLVHELGHFWTARKFKVLVEEFGFGFPPKLFSWVGKKTTYSLNWIPIGGFVKIKGEGGECKNEEDSFSYQKAWKRLIILVAGVSMNIILAFVLLSIGFMIGLPGVVDQQVNGADITNEKVQIVQIEKNSIAEKIGLQTNDQIISIDDQNVISVESVIKQIQNDSDRKLNILIKRANQTISKEATFAAGEKMVLGVYLVKSGIVQYPWWQAIVQGFKATIYTLVQIVLALFLLIKGVFVGQGPSLELAGPIGVAVLTGEMKKMGIAYLLQFTAFLSLNLAIVNLLPLPALDGGRILFIIIEKIRRKPNNEDIERIIHSVGFFALLFVMFLVTYKDLSKYGGHLIEIVKNYIN